jgi:hypothetical protein
VVELLKEFDLRKINIIQMPLDFYRFALPDCAGGLATSHKITFQTDPSTGAKVIEGEKVAKKGAKFSLSFSDPLSSSTVNTSSFQQQQQQHLLKLENHAAILMQLENDSIQLKQYLASPHIGNLRLKVNGLADTVSQLQELMHLVTKCQEQVW